MPVVHVVNILRPNEPFLTLETSAFAAKDKHVQLCMETNAFGAEDELV